jgi:hypothetical protein
LFNRNLRDKYPSAWQYVTMATQDDKDVTLRDVINHFDAKFQRVDDRFDGIDQRFEGIDKRFDGIDSRDVQLGGTRQGGERRTPPTLAAETGTSESSR